MDTQNTNNPKDYHPMTLSFLLSSCLQFISSIFSDNVLRSGLASALKSSSIKCS